MLILLTAVLTASLLGSLHCVGMCGPLAIWASGATGASGGKQRPAVRAATTCYHAGRLTTYLILGVLAGGLGSLIDAGGAVLGIQVMAARIVGGLMILLGLGRLRQLALEQRGSRTVKVVRPSRIGGWLVKLRPLILSLPLAQRGFVTGLLTTLLPCGWLYLFALIAAATASMVTGPMVMLAFWSGTVPALVSLVIGVRLLSPRFAIGIPFLASALLIATGVFTASGRGFAAVNSIAELRAASTLIRWGTTDQISEQVEHLHAQPLPCCQFD